MRFSVPRVTPWILRCLARLALPLLAVAGARAAETWIVGRTQHFEMYSSASPAESRKMLLALEQFRANFLSVVPLRGAAEPRTTVVLFDRDSAFRPYKPLYQGKPKPVSGYFLPDPDEVVIALTTDLPNLEADPREVIYHEYVHLLLHTRDSRFPLWLDEGLAEVYSTFKLEDGKVEYGAAKQSHVDLLGRSALLPLPKLFAVTHDSPDYNEDDRMSIFYAESWAFTHLLLFGQDTKNAAKLAEFAKRLAAGAAVEPSFRQAFGSDFKAEENALRHYLDGGGYYKRGKPAVALDIPVNFQPAADVDRDLALLNLKWRVQQNGDAAAAALALLDKDPTKPRPHELLAAIATQSGDSVTAQEHWQRAAELKSDNVWVYVQLLRAALDVYQGVSLLDTRLPAERIEQLRGWANRAYVLSPESADVVELAMVIEALAEKMDIRVINRTQSRVPAIRNPARALLAMGIVHWRGNDLKGARALAEMVLAQPKADMPTRAGASALRGRLPAPEQPAGVAVGDGAAHGVARPAITLQSGQQGEAAAYLDQLLAERGTTAAREQLEPLVVRAADADAGAWQHTDELRRKVTGGDADAMFELAVAHACGTGAEFSPALATEWLQKAIDHGNALAKSGFAPGKLQPDLVAQFLRRQRTSGGDAALPPLDEELKRRIGEAASASERHAPVVLYRAAPRYPESVRRTGQRGTAVVRFTIGTDGHPEDLQTAKFSDPTLVPAIETCVRGWRFIPTIRDGKPARTFVELAVTFEPGAAPATPPRT